MDSNGVLGRGLSALLPGSASPAGARLVELERIEPDPEQPRKTFEPESIESLAASIRKHGLLQPVIVRRRGDGYILLAGERRFRAAKEAGLKEISVVVREDAGLTGFEIALVENLQREDLNPVDEAIAYSRLINEGKRTQRSVAEAVGRSRAYITNSLRLMKLVPEALEALRTGEISSGHARAVLMISDANDQKSFLQRMIDEGWSVRRAEREARNFQPVRGQSKPSKSAMEPYYRNVATQLQTGLGSAVRIRAKGTRGTLEITFDDLSQLSNLSSLLLPNSGLCDSEEAQVGDESKGAA
tara:strand:+ start:98 stop:997 length:900 start_codon:yes stop_codon:yes gene_type:complete